MNAKVLAYNFSGFANQRISDEAFALMQDCRQQLQRQWDARQTLDCQLMAA